MSNIEEVIERSRQGGGFTERKKFTVARSRAIQKMRQFALADPHYYILELIQAAVSNGSKYIDVVAEENLVALSYIGGGYREEELAQLFDYLFSSKEELEHADMRSLAIGINALLIMKPKEIVVESGDGTLKGTTRVVISGRDDSVEVGRPDQPLEGTFIRGSGLKRHLIGGKSKLSSHMGAPECAAIEQRCMAAPVPLIINGEALFGYSSLRTPYLFGHANSVQFDEGDLYGTIGIPVLSGNPTFKLLVSGVWIQSVTERFYSRPVGGIIAFDQLRKTADHSGIVQDEVYDSLWVRLRPYARRVCSGEGTGRVTYRVRCLLSGPNTSEELDRSYLSPMDLRAVLAKEKYAVLVPDETDQKPHDLDKAYRIGRALGATVLALPATEIDAVRTFGGEIQLTRPFLHRRDLAFYEQEAVSEPPKPWLAAPIEVPPLDWFNILEPEEKKALLNPAGEIKAKVYTPAALADEKGLRVRIITVDRLVWEGSLACDYPGHVLDIRVPEVSPGAIRKWPTGCTSGHADPCTAIAEAMRVQSLPQVAEATSLALESMSLRDISADSGAAKIVLSELARNTTKTVRRSDQPVVVFQTDARVRGVDLLEIPVFRTLSGEDVSLRDLEQMMHSCCGLVYGVVPDVRAHLKGLDQTKILDLDLSTERLLIAIVGEASYVRIDRRDFLGQYGTAWCRDIAVGILPYPEFPLLLEGIAPGLIEPNTWPRVEQLKCLEKIVGQLIEWCKTPRDEEASEENRRQAIRHLQWFLSHHEAWPCPDFGAADLPLFLDEHRKRMTWRELSQLLAKGPVAMFDGHAVDAADLSALAADFDVARIDQPTGPAQPATDTALPDRGLAMNPFLLHLLGQRSQVRPTFDFPLVQQEEEEEVAFLASAEVKTADLNGVIGVPKELPARWKILLVEPEYRGVHILRTIAQDYGVVGQLMLESSDVLKKSNWLYTEVRFAAREALTALVGKLPELAPAERERALTTLLGYAARRTTLIAEPDGEIVPQVMGTVADRILDLPLFEVERGAPVSGRRLLSEFCSRKEPMADPLLFFKHSRLAADTPQVLLDWIESTMQESRVVHPSSRSMPVVDFTPTTNEAERMARRMTYWLEQLRSDKSKYNTVVFVVDPPTVFVPTDHPGGSFDWSSALADPSSGWLYDYDGAGQHPSLYVNAHHFVYRWSEETQGKDPEAFAWLMLSAYAYLNELLEPVTNEHEMLFQREVAEQLERGFT